MNLPSIIDAPLPAVYERATKALAECSRIDECKDWADKARAMASYARQAKDDTLYQMALRIQARAIRRVGQLLQEIEPKRGIVSSEKGGTHPLSASTRKQAAVDAGLSDDQRKTALRVASVPEPAFTAQVESPQPPTITSLAKQGTTAKPLVDLGTIPPKDYARATQGLGLLRDFVEFASANDAARIAAAVKPHEYTIARRQVAQIDAWLDAFVVNLREQ